MVPQPSEDVRSLGRWPMMNSLMNSLAPPKLTPVLSPIQSCSHQSIHYCRCRKTWGGSREQTPLTCFEYYCRQLTGKSDLAVAWKIGGGSVVGLVWEQKVRCAARKA